MFSKLFKISLIIFTILFTVQLLGFLFFILSATVVQADSSMPNWAMPDLQIDIGGLKGKFSQPTECGADAQGNKKYCIPWIGQYIAGVYQYAIGIVGILSAVVLMFGGIIWLTAGGNATQISNAKSWIGASLSGLVIALCSYMILYLVNPDLTVFKPLGISMVKKVEIQSSTNNISCQWQRYICENDWTAADNDNKCSGPSRTEAERSAGIVNVCCCQNFGSTAMCKVTAAAPTYCGTCSDCVDVKTSGIFCKENPCLVNKDLYAKLTALYALNQKWLITEPWPPTVPHADSCHKNGTCVDIALSSQPMSGDICTYVVSLIADLKKAGFTKITNEYKNCGGTVYGTTTGDNIHISL